VLFDWNQVAELLQDQPTRTALGSRLRRELMDQYAPVNAELAETWGVTFPDDLPQSEPDEPLDLPSVDELRRIASMLGRRRVRKAAGEPG
jgi:hypothetical protein